MHFPKIKISRSKADFAIQQKNQTGAQRQRVRFGKEEQRRKRALIFIKNRSKRYKACSDVVRVAIQDLWRSPKTKPEPSHSGSGLERRSGGVSAL